MTARTGRQSTARSLTRRRVAMDTIVSIEAVSAEGQSDIDARIAAGFAWFTEVEARCSRFDRKSELSRLCDCPGVAVPVSPLLFRAIEFALAVAADSGGAFDPTVGDAMARAGFRRNYQDGSACEVRSAAPSSFRDVCLNAAGCEVTLRTPLTLDLGAVAKGLAIDLAAQELSGIDGFLINAGGDIYAGGMNPDGHPWVIGVRDPREFDSLVARFSVSGAAVCTSGDYERASAVNPADHHILQPANGRAAAGVASVTVVAPTAMAADALATAAFVLGPREGIAFLEANGADGLAITPTGERFETPGLKGYLE
ncbi:MAG: FAD:protein FMN transferase [Dehalococcoidia bacterium]|nr:FAD:protein FMN transferase [Dehalococcoidia bacterium]